LVSKFFNLIIVIGEKMEKIVKKNINNKKLAKQFRIRNLKTIMLLLMNKTLKVILIILTLNRLKNPTSNLFKNI